mgnify:CR=1 FL=1
MKAQISPPIVKTFYAFENEEDLIESKVPVEARAFRPAEEERRTVPTLNAPEEGGPTVLRRRHVP